MSSPRVDATIVLPIKEICRAKSRLEIPVYLRQAIALRLAENSLGVAVAAVSARRVIVVTSDALVQELAGQVGAGVVNDGGQGLNVAAARGVAAARAAFPELRTNVLVADLPWLTLPSLEHTLAVLARSDSSVIVSDAQGVGTTLLSLPAKCTVQMVFGRDSAIRFAAQGCHALSSAPQALRMDLDTTRDLRAMLLRAAFTEDTESAEPGTSFFGRWNRLLPFAV